MDRRGFLVTSFGASLPLFLPGAHRSDDVAPHPARRDITCGLAPNGVQYCTVGIKSLTAQQVSQKQNLPEWCWAASIAMIFGYYGHPVSQARIVSEAYGAIVNMPGSPAAILGSLNRPWIDDAGVPFVATTNPMTPNYMTGIADLQGNHPQLLGTLGHAVVLTAMTYAVTPFGPQVTEAIVRDPWPFSPSRRVLTPYEWGSIQFAAQIRLS